MNNPAAQKPYHHGVDLICPHCGSPNLRAGEKGLSCAHCSVAFPYTADGVNFLCEAPPSHLADKWELWTKLQHQGAVSYDLSPELNLSNEQTFDLDAFDDFAALSGRVLDIGCGPQPHRPRYIRTDAIDYVGVDPLPASLLRQFPCHRALGEQLPFADCSFDRVLFINSLDHTLSWRDALHQACRVLRGNGRLCLVTDAAEKQGKASPPARWATILRKLLRQISYGLRTMGMRKTLRYLMGVAGFRVPRGAVDPFHMAFPDPDEIETVLIELGMNDIQRQSYRSAIFLRAVKPQASPCAE